MKFQLQYLAKFVKFMLCFRAYDNRILVISETEERTLTDSFSHRNYTPGKGNHFTDTSVEKKMVSKKGHLSKYERLLTFHANRLSTNVSSLKRDFGS